MLQIGVSSHILIPAHCLIESWFSHVWLFEGAEGGKWVRDIEEGFLDTESTSSTIQGRVKPEGSEAKKLRIS